MRITFMNLNCLVFQTPAMMSLSQITVSYILSTIFLEKLKENNQKLGFNEHNRWAPVLS